MRSFGAKEVMKLLFAAALTFAVLAVPARPQSYAGSRSLTFTLSFDAQWGLVKLSAGTYSFTLDDAIHAHQVILSQGTRYVGIVPYAEFSDEKKANLQPSLLCVRHDSTFSVRALRLPQLGTFYYSVPKDKNKTVAQSPELIQDVPVILGGK